MRMTITGSCCDGVAHTPPPLVLGNGCEKVILPWCIFLRVILMVMPSLIPLAPQSDPLHSILALFQSITSLYYIVWSVMADFQISVWEWLLCILVPICGLFLCPYYVLSPLFLAFSLSPPTYFWSQLEQSIVYTPPLDITCLWGKLRCFLESVVASCPPFLPDSWYYFYETTDIQHHNHSSNLLFLLSLGFIFSCTDLTVKSW